MGVLVDAVSQFVEGFAVVTAFACFYKTIVNSFTILVEGTSVAYAKKPFKWFYHYEFSLKLKNTDLV